MESPAPLQRKAAFRFLPSRAPSELPMHRVLRSTLLPVARCAPAPGGLHSEGVPLQALTLLLFRNYRFLRPLPARLTFGKIRPAGALRCSQFPPPSAKTAPPAKKAFRHVCFFPGKRRARSRSSRQASGRCRSGAACQTGRQQLSVSVPYLLDEKGAVAVF